METLLSVNGYDQFLIKFEGDDFESSASFEVFEVTAWEADGPAAPCEWESYLRGTIKWDGCSHIYFGDEEGYLHLCGKHYWDNHNKMMSALWDLCASKIRGFNADIAS